MVYALFSRTECEERKKDRDNENAYCFVVEK